MNVKVRIHVHQIWNVLIKLAATIVHDPRNYQKCKRNMIYKIVVYKLKWFQNITVNPVEKD